ncbi:MAG: DUF1236 domain-containing protein [Beijerinckiaceae bacterium]|nr:DUF1236 domain-containing protein [Beijerinckiaceae bacterium]
MKTLIAASVLSLGLVAGSAAFATPAHVPLPPEKPITLAQNDVTSGGITRQITNEDRAYLRRYRTERNIPSVTYDRHIVIGDELPGSVTYYQVEGRPSVSNYRYTVINGRTVLVEPTSHRVVEVID